MAQFFTDLNRILGPTALRRMVRQLLENNGLALAGQLAYLFILFLFPFLIFLVTLAGIVVNDPETASGTWPRGWRAFGPTNRSNLSEDTSFAPPRVRLWLLLSRPSFSL